MQDQINKLIREWFDDQGYEFVPGKTKIPLSAPQYGAPEVCEALDSMLNIKVTMGEKVRKFERMFADYIGVEHAVMVNSGSSANLLALSVLTNPIMDGHIKQGGEIITPAVTWATTVYPIANVGCVPVLVDIDIETLDMSVEETEKVLSDKTRALMPVHLLGNPCEMKELGRIADENNLFMVEDSCEAHGSEYMGNKIGSFGDLSTFSFYFAHHISTIEGGMVITNNERLAELTRAMRTFGWIRDMRDKDEIAKRYDIDDRFLFITTGYNFRPTEIQGAFGMHQLGRLEEFISIRRENATYWSKQLQEYGDIFIVHKERPNTRHVWYGYPITIKPNEKFTRRDMIQFLESRNIETRPVMAGNMAEQPSMSHIIHKKGILPNAEFVMRNSLFLGNHHMIRKKEREYVAQCIDDFLRSK